MRGSIWRPRRVRGRVVTSALLCGSLVVAGAALVRGSASAAVQRVDLRVLVLDDGSPWVQAIASQLKVEGVPATSVNVSDPAHSPITASTLADADHAFYQAVVAPSAVSGSVSTGEWAAIRAFEAQFSIREVDGFNWPESSVGLTPPFWAGNLTGITASTTPAAARAGFQYLRGPVTFGVGSYGYLSTALTATTVPPLPLNATFTPLVTAAAPGTTTAGSLVGVYTHDGLEQMVITAAMAFGFTQFKSLAHGIISWMTRGVHLGYDRNYLTFHVDDAFANDALWDPAHNCTPGEDCPLGADGLSIYPESSARMTADDVAYAVAWQTANQYTFTLAFNGNGIAAGDALTTAFQTNRTAFRWLNHGLVHIYQGCVQDFTVVPWKCTTDSSGAVQWVPQADIQNEIQANITAGQSIGLTFDTHEYLSGEHSGLAQPPQQPVDNPNFAAAVAATGLTAIGADASRGPASRIVGGAVTVPRHPTALYYNTSTAAAAVDEYNWLYNSRANGGSGYCEDNASIATCIAPLDPATGFANYIVPTDAAYDLGFVLSNDPRPFYAHTSNMTGDRLLYPLVQTILANYRASFASSAPVVNLTLTQAATVLQRQAKWAAASSGTPAVTAYLEGNTVTIANPTGVSVPLTMPSGTTVVGATMQSYGGELSGWTSAIAPTAALPATQLTFGGSANFVEGRAGSMTARSNTNATLEFAGTLPAGLTWGATGTGSYAISGTPAAGTAGSYPVTVTATSATGTATATVTIVVSRAPSITSATSAYVLSGVPFRFVVTTGGAPAPSIRINGTLPAGLTWADQHDGTAVISGTTTFNFGGTTRVTVTATNLAGSVSRTLSLVGASKPSFTTASTRTLRVGSSTAFVVGSSGRPVATMTLLDRLPTGLTFRDRGDGTAVVSGTPAAGTAGNWTVRVSATNVAGTSTQTLTLAVLP